MTPLLGIALASAPEVGTRSTIAATTGAVPAAAAGLIGLPAVWHLARNADGHDLPSAKVALALAPGALLGELLLVGGGLRAREALVVQGAEPPAWPGYSAAGLGAVALGTWTVAAGAATPADRGWLVVGEVAWLGSVGLGVGQLGANAAAQQDLGARSPSARLKRGEQLYHAGQLFVVGAPALGLGLGLPFVNKIEPGSAGEALLGAELATAGLLTLAGTPLMVAGAMEERRALEDAGEDPGRAPGVASSVCMGVAPLQVVGAVAAFQADRTGLGVMLVLTTAGTVAAAPLLASTQHRRASGGLPKMEPVTVTVAF